MRWQAFGLTLAGLVAAGCATLAAGTDSKLAVFDRKFFEQCPFGVAQPSLTLVTNQSQWRRMLTSARTAPPPFEASATTFDTKSVLVLATRTTGTPRTRLWVKDDAFVLNPATRSLQVGIDVKEVRPAVGEIEVAVVGLPCLVIWTSRINAASRVEARDSATGALLADARTP